MYFLYILYSVQADRYYIGVTHDLEGRLRRHNSHYKKG
ncbi:GIY-YIG nuclease family protein, partial [Sphingobacterium spiritivorum]